MAKRCMTGVYPLYYEMKKATAEEINPHNLYKGLDVAVAGGGASAMEEALYLADICKSVTIQGKV